MATALRLHDAGLPVTILEASSTAGGRIQAASLQANTHQDLGPSWVWPYAQPVITKWLKRLGLQTFPQYDRGDALIDNHPIEPAIAQFLPGQHGIARIQGGTYAIIEAMLPILTVHMKLNNRVTACDWIDGEFIIEVTQSQEKKSSTLNSDYLVIATPPRIAATILAPKFQNNKTALQNELTDVFQVLQQTPTWMAPHAKVVMFYDTAFWRERGLSGRIASHTGPLAEIHDHCGPDGTPAALFGFAGLPAHMRTDQDAFMAAIQHQLRRCFGKDAPTPERIVVKDWADDQFIATASDLTQTGNHPTVINELARQGWCDKKLWFAASETSTISPGLIEGALARADQVADQIIANI